MKGRFAERLVLVVAGLVLLGVPIAAQSFPGLGDDVTRTYGKLYLYVAPDFRDLLNGYSGYDPKARRWVSPPMYDPATQIGRSAPHLDGSEKDKQGTEVGTAKSKVADIDFWEMPAEFKGPAGAREIHTELRSLRMGYPGMAIRAGIQAKDQPPSYGEIQSKSGNSQDPKKDFPARSFFNVFVEVDIPNLGGQSSVTLYNKTPMLLTDDAVTSFPPETVYRHISSSACEILFKSDNPGKWKKDDVLGFLVLAGHGVKVGINPLTKKLESWSENRMKIYPGPSGTVTAIQDRQVGGGKVMVLDEPNNTVSTVLPPLTGQHTGWYPVSMMMGPFNKDLWLTYLDAYNRSGEIHVLDQCGLRASTRALKWAPYGCWRSDQNGIYWVMRDALYADKIFHTDWEVGEASLTTVFTNLPQHLVGLCEHEDTGLFVAVSGDSAPTGALSLVDIHEKTVVRWMYGFGHLTGGVFHKGYNRFYAVENTSVGVGRLYQVDLMRGKVTTVLASGIDEITSITYNRDQSLLLGARHELLKFDPFNNTIVERWKFGQNRYQVIQSAAQFGTSAITFDTSKGSGPGSRVPIHVSFPQSSAMGSPYILAASGGLRPGIPINGQYLNLRPDPMFLISALNVIPTIFEKFQGYLDTGGGTTAYLNIPNIPALKGNRIYVGGLVIPPYGKAMIVSNCEGLTIR